MLADSFWSTVAPALLDPSLAVHRGSVRRGSFIELEKKLIEHLASLLRSTDSRYAEEAVYGLSILVDRESVASRKD